MIHSAGFLEYTGDSRGFITLKRTIKPRWRRVLEVEGKILEILETQQVSERFRKREFVMEYATNPEYPEYLKFEMVQDRCEQLDGFQV